MQDENDEAADEDPDMEGELTSADYRKLQSLVDEQEQAVQAGDDILLELAGFLTCTQHQAVLDCGRAPSCYMLALLPWTSACSARPAIYLSQHVAFLPIY